MHDDAPTLPFAEPLSDTSAPIELPRHRPRSRGNAAKIAAALEALIAAGLRPDLLRQCELIERCDGWLEQQGLSASERPHRSSYVRFWRKRTK